MGAGLAHSSLGSTVDGGLNFLLGVSHHWFSEAEYRVRSAAFLRVPELPKVNAALR